MMSRVCTSVSYHITTRESWRTVHDGTVCSRDDSISTEREGSSDRLGKRARRMRVEGAPRPALRLSSTTEWSSPTRRELFEVFQKYNFLPGCDRGRSSHSLARHVHS